MTWKKRFTKHRDWEYVKIVKLPGGYRMRMAFWVDDWKPERVSTVRVSVACAPWWRLWLHSLTDFEGSPTGPGAGAVLPAALRLLEEVEQVAPHKAKYQKVQLEVEAATVRLWHIYQAVLSKRGYFVGWINDPFEPPAMVKILRKEYNDSSCN